MCEYIHASILQIVEQGRKIQDESKQSLARYVYVCMYVCMCIRFQSVISMVCICMCVCVYVCECESRQSLARCVCLCMHVCMYVCAYVLQCIVQPILSLAMYV